MEYDVKQRIKEVLSFNRTTITAISKSLGLKQNTLSRQINGDTAISMETLLSIIGLFPNLSLDWLITGNGSMIKGEAQSAPTVNEAHVGYRFVPLLNLDAVGGMHRSNEEAATAEYPEKLIPFVDAKEGDICLTVSGDSMAPTCPSGSLVLVRKVERWQEYFGFGNLFVLLLADGRRILKEVQKYEGDPQNFVLCKSHNEKYPAEELPKKLISAVWKVVKMQSDRGW